MWGRQHCIVYLFASDLALALPPPWDLESAFSEQVDRKRTMSLNLVSVLLVFSTLGCVELHASDGESAPSQATVVRTTFLASDLQPMLGLYRDILGYELVYSDEYQGQTFRQIFDIDEDARVEFAILKPPTDDGGSIGILVVGDDLASSIHPSDYAAEFGQAILFSTTNNLDAVYERVQSADASVVTVVTAPFATTGGREMVIADANGVRIYVFELEEATPD